MHFNDRKSKDVLKLERRKRSQLSNNQETEDSLIAKQKSLFYDPNQADNKPLACEPLHICQRHLKEG